MQVQAAGPEASLDVSGIRLVNARQSSRLADALNWHPGATWQGFRTVPIDAVAAGRSDRWLSYLRLVDWFVGNGSNAQRTGERLSVTVEGVPFELLGRMPNLAVTAVRSKSELRLPVSRMASEVYLLLLAAMTGTEEPAYGSGQLREIGDVDRFRLRLEYGDGTADECLPMNVATGRFGVVSGPQALVAPADPTRHLNAVILCDATRQAAFAVAAMTIRTDATPLHPAGKRPHSATAGQAERPIIPSQCSGCGGGHQRAADDHTVGPSAKWLAILGRAVSSRRASR